MLITSATRAGRSWPSTSTVNSLVTRTPFPLTSSQALQTARPRTLEPAGTGLVKATATAKGDLVGLDIDPTIFDPNEKEVVEDLILAAIKDAQAKAAERMEQEMAKVTEGLGLPAGMPNPFG